MGAALIGLDWGTSSFRAALMDESGRVLDRRAAPRGILSVSEGRFDAVLDAEIADWERAHPDIPILASGMISSRQGWVETPYIACPAGAAELAAALVPHRSPARLIRFVTGLSVRHDDGVPDVMRGEETQILGAVADGPGSGVFVLPGTHSKWARIEGGRIVRFRTFMTGEVYAALRSHSILGRLMEGDADDSHAFRRGLDAGSAPGTAGALLARLFGVRTLGLFDDLPVTGLASYLSGLLLGAEIREALAQAEADLTIVAEPGLAERYRHAFARFGVPVRVAEGDAAARGQFHIARLAGLLP